MVNIRFIKEITNHLNRDRVIIGNCVYYQLENRNKAKAWCDYHGVHIEIINNKEGKVDGVYLPFEHYFEPVQCHKGTQWWYQSIEINSWMFERQYEHVLPKASDYINLCNAMESYIAMFE